jgi:hypothetical protein
MMNGFVLIERQRGPFKKIGIVKVNGLKYQNMTNQQALK